MAANPTIADCDSFSNVPSSPAHATNSTTNTTTNTPHKRQKKRPRIKYWSLPTVSSGTFDPRFLTERQQLQYLAQKSKGVGDDALEVSPLRLDRIKLEERKMMGSVDKGDKGDKGEKKISIASTHKSSPLAKSPRESSKPSKGSKETKENASPLSNSQLSNTHNTTHFNTHTNAHNNIPVSTKKRSFSFQVQSSPFSSTLSPSLNANRRSRSRTGVGKNSLLRVEGVEEMIREEMRAVGGVDRVIVDGVDCMDTSIVDTTSNSIVDTTPTSSIVDTTLTSTTSIHPTSTTHPTLADHTQQFLDYSNNVRLKHLDALMDAIMRRTGMSLEEVQSKRKEILSKYQ